MGSEPSIIGDTHAGRARRAASHAGLTLRLGVTIRPCRAADLPALEWYGLYWRHREIFREAFERQERGETTMLLAVANGFPVGQIFLDYDRAREESTAVYWAVRVYPFLQGLGLGSALIGAAEEQVRRRAIAWAELGVEIENADARRLYERLGYEVAGEMREECAYRTPSGARERMVLREWRMRKRIRSAPEWERSAEGAR